jgi:uncharacterized protein YndB with AHSA1/START domain
MPSIRVRTTIDAPPREVWRAIEDIDRHVDWMEDAVAIRFTSRKHSGKGAAFECDTRIGPLRLTDLMEITEWSPRKTMGVRHVGLVTGVGRFTLRRARGGRTRFSWQEKLTFPRWLGGPIGGAAAKPILKRVWKRNLANLKRLVEGDDQASA